ncbi:MAG: hypothetical protein QXF56_04250 [Candidatus Micrarchaeia archaeon]
MQKEMELNLGRTEPYVLQKIPKEVQGRVQHIEKVGEMLLEEPLKTIRVKGYAVLFNLEDGRGAASLVIIDGLGRRFLGKTPVLEGCNPAEGVRFCREEWEKLQKNPEKLNTDSRFWERVGSGWPVITR